MSKLYVDNDRYAARPQTLLVEAVHGSVRDLVRRKFTDSGVDWKDFVFGASNELITKDDFVAIEKKFIDLGYKFGWSAAVSAEERPDLYKAMEGMTGDLEGYSFQHPEAITAPPDSDGREQRGVGDNVVRHKHNVRGTARYIRSAQMVLDYMNSGVPEETIAIIDDSGGTLTAPIMEKFAGIICAGGTVRSHMGILAREYGVPCLMNSRVDGVYEGDTVEIEVSAPAKTASDYAKGKEVTARIWRIVESQNKASGA